MRSELGCQLWLDVHYFLEFQGKWKQEWGQIRSTNIVKWRALKLKFQDFNGRFRFCTLGWWTLSSHVFSMGPIYPAWTGRWVSNALWRVLIVYQCCNFIAIHLNENGGGRVFFFFLSVKPFKTVGVWQMVSRRGFWAWRELRNLSTVYLDVQNGKAVQG